jgi:uncharacterized protein (UPF0335 family)
MLKRNILIMLLLAVFSMAAMADVIYLKSGRTLEVDNAKIDGDKVVFTVFNGRMSIARSAVVKIVKTETKAHPRAGLRETIGQPRFTQAASQRKSSLNNSEGGDEENPLDEAKKHYIDKRKRLLKEMRFATEQVKTLQSTIFAKSAINASTTQDRARLLKFQRQAKELQAEIEEIPFEARRAGLDPGAIRDIENTRLEDDDQNADADGTVIGGIEEKDPRNADVDMSDEGVDDASRNSKTELKEDPIIQ